MRRMKRDQEVFLFGVVFIGGDLWLVVLPFFRIVTPYCSLCVIESPIQKAEVARHAVLVRMLSQKENTESS